MSHVDHQECAYLVGNLAHTGIVPLTAVGRAATDDEFRLLFECETLHLIIVHAACLLVEIVAHRIVEDSGGVDMAAMREVAAVVEVESHEGVAWLEHRKQHGCVGLCARVGLYVGVFSTEELFHALDGESLGLVHHLTSAVIALARIALGIFVGEA